jgi:excisionase family DNA binding protein
MTEVMPMTAMTAPPAVPLQPASRVYTPAEIAAALRVSEESVRREIRRGKLGAARVGNQYRSTLNDLSGWLGERYLELFSPLGALSSLIGQGGLDEAEANALALEIVATIREAKRSATQEETPTLLTAPTAAEVTARIALRRAQEASADSAKPLL